MILSLLLNKLSLEVFTVFGRFRVVSGQMLAFLIRGTGFDNTQTIR